MGNLTRDPESRALPSGTTVTNFGIAVNETWKDKTTGEKREDVCYIDVDAWGRQGEVVSQFFHKGKPILVEGRLKLNTWDADDGTKRSKHTVTLDKFSFISDGGGNGNGSTSKKEALDDIPF